MNYNDTEWNEMHNELIKNHKNENEKKLVQNCWLKCGDLKFQTHTHTHTHTRARARARARNKLWKYKIFYFLLV